MKAERRHELKENELARVIGDFRTYMQTRGQRLLLVGGGILVVFVAVWFYRQNKSESIGRDWVRYTEILASTPEDGWADALAELRRIGRESRDTSLSITALSKAGHTALRLALQTPEPEKAEAFNDEAEEIFDELRSRWGRFDVARGVALCGLATVAENRFAFDGDASQKDVARKLLDEVANDARLNGTPMKNQAISRLATLDEVFTPVTFAPPEPKPEPASSDAGDPAAEGAPAGSPASTTPSEPAPTGSSATPSAPQP
ncbi:MAG: hypothetical protein BroJett003_15750 [Planctomycetota bacterium]|nr:MAG: hypothetical protein BroJett003_15750 [Planctomycetota bacterium]